MTQALRYSGLIIKPTENFYNWISGEEIGNQLSAELFELLKSTSLDVMRANATVMAVPLISGDKESAVKKFVAKNASDIIEVELSRWELSIDEKPSDTDDELVQAWFDISYHTHIFSFDDEGK
tara:strand:- start:2338 stop:2706 length:369 start_codon:yes stop_codon:yes gene_type:complete